MKKCRGKKGIKSWKRKRRHYNQEMIRKHTPYMTNNALKIRGVGPVRKKAMADAVENSIVIAYRKYVCSKRRAEQYAS